MTDKAKLFESGSGFNALANALVLASGAESFMDDKVYDFMEKTPRTSFIVHLVDSLEDYGYKIVKI
jgi:hypothetical protein